MFTSIHKLVEADPFIPFTIHLADGTQLRVPTADDIALTPSGACIMVFTEDARWDIDPEAMIKRVTVDQMPAPVDPAQGEEKAEGSPTKRKTD